ncbi:MAG: glycosyltransferase [Gelidibacter sp.]|nr:glycosyltransferase [Gelidibacter sp.]
MNKGRYKVSIIIATYNRAHLIVETLQSIKKQTHQNWECIIVDDGGTDNTHETIRPILSNDHRFQFLKRPEAYKKGLSGCRNYGLDLATGDYIIFFDDDDIVHPQNLELCLFYVNQHPNLFFCHYKKEAFQGHFDKVYLQSLEPKAVETGDDFYEKVLTYEIPMASCTVLWKKECFDKVRFNETLLYAEDWECYQKILSTQVKGVVLNENLYFNRKHVNSNTGDFYAKSPIRLASKKKAITLITIHLASKQLLSEKALNFLITTAIPYRDIRLMNEIIKIASVNLKKKVHILLKFYMFPIWKEYHKFIKK